MRSTLRDGALTGSQPNVVLSARVLYTGVVERGSSGVTVVKTATGTYTVRPSIPMTLLAAHATADSPTGQQQYANAMWQADGTVIVRTYFNDNTANPADSSFSVTLQGRAR